MVVKYLIYFAHAIDATIAVVVRLYQANVIINLQLDKAGDTHNKSHINEAILQNK
jgi:hypothetical protein